MLQMQYTAIKSLQCISWQRSFKTPSSGGMERLELPMDCLMPRQPVRWPVRARVHLGKCYQLCCFSLTSFCCQGILEIFGNIQGCNDSLDFFVTLGLKLMIMPSPPLKLRIRWQHSRNDITLSISSMGFLFMYWHSGQNWWCGQVCRLRLGLIKIGLSRHV